MACSLLSPSANVPSATIALRFKGGRDDASCISSEGYTWAARFGTNSNMHPGCDTRCGALSERCRRPGETEQDTKFLGDGHLVGDGESRSRHRSDGDPNLVESCWRCDRVERPSN